jgi:Domain of unknown function (DUF4277)
VAHLPLLGARLRELALPETLDALVPPHARHAGTVGACVAAVVWMRLTGEQAVSRVADTLAGDDREGICHRPLAAAPVHDHRVGRALEALWTAGLDRRYGAVSSRAIPPYARALARRHTEATSLNGSGADARHAYAAGPWVTSGDRRAHRPDRTPWLCGLPGTADGVPGWGPVPAGHRRDRVAQRCHLPPRRQHLPALGAPRLVADRQCLAGEPLPWAAAHRCRVVTWVPQTVGVRQAVVETPELRAWPGRWEPPGRRPGARDASRGASVGRPSRGKTAAGERPEVPWRVLVVESTPLATANAPRLPAAQKAARAIVATRHQPGPRRTLAWQADAPQAATRCLRALSWHHPHLPATAGTAGLPAQRATRGPPPQEAPRPQRQVWRGSWPGPQAPAAIAMQAPRERRCGWATHGLEAEPLGEAHRRRASTGQPAVELRVHWAQTPASLAPIVLETPPRRAALGGVSWIARLIDPVVARQVRTRLAARGDT